MFPPPASVEDIAAQHTAVAALCSSLDPSLIGDHEVGDAFQHLAAMQKLISGACVRIAARYEAVGDWKRNGSRSAEDDIARRTGTSISRAKRSLGTSRKLGSLDRVDDALRKGDLSPDQADEVTAGASASPDDEEDLLETARKEPLPSLRKKVADARARADRDREARRARQHRMRRVRRWLDDDGLYNLLLKLPPEMGAEVDAALAPGIDRAFADARDAGRFEPFEAYAADVVHRLLTGQGASASTHTSDFQPPGRRSQAVRPDRKVIALVDIAALNRGYTVGDETSVLAGVGPVSVSAIRAMLADAFVSVVFTNGVDILNVTHLGRQVTAQQRTALEARGYRCEIEGCGVTHHLEIDHIIGWSLTHTTRLEDLCWLCPHHHKLKTRKRLRLVGPVGARRLATSDATAGPDPPEGVTVQDDLFTTAF